MTLTIWAHEIDYGAGACFVHDGERPVIGEQVMVLYRPGAPRRSQEPEHVVPATVTGLSSAVGDLTSVAFRADMARAERVYSTAEVATAAEVSCRRVDHWRVQNYVTPLRDTEGSGRQVRWSRRNVAEVALIASLADIAPNHLHAAARNLADHAAFWWPETLPRRSFVDTAGRVTTDSPATGPYVALPAKAIVLAALNRLEGP